MSHRLDFIKRDNILKALEVIDQKGVPKNHQWNEYWIKYYGKFYPFKYVVREASLFTSNSINTTDFSSNHSSRHQISSLGFNIQFRKPNIEDIKPSFWIAASYFGPKGNQVDQFANFFEGSFWQTDHDLSYGEGARIYSDLQRVKINDRIGIRYLDKKGSNLYIKAVGTVYNVSEIEYGKLGVIWDYHPFLYKGIKPTGVGAGNLWRTFVEIKRPIDIRLIFNSEFIEKRISRLTWNDNGWIMPSGPAGKSTYKNTHEAQYGYGHEEWLFDTGKLIDGYHYGFLEPIRKEQQAYEDRSYHIWLYTIDAKTKNRYFIGEILKVEVLKESDAERIKQIYAENGWLHEMEQQIKSSGGNAKGFSNWKGVDLLNIRYKPKDIKPLTEYILLPPDHPVVSLSRYSFAHFRHEFDLSLADNAFKYNPPKSKEQETEDDKVDTSVHFREPKQIEITYLHKSISKRLTKVLREHYGNENVSPEHPTCNGCRVDIVVNHSNRFIFYEIKTYNSINYSIREALGQLLEYAFWPSQQNAQELVIVTQVAANPETVAYFAYLRQKLGLEIYYQSFDVNTGLLSSKS